MITHISKAVSFNAECTEVAEVKERNNFNHTINTRLTQDFSFSGDNLVKSRGFLKDYSDD